MKINNVSLQNFRNHKKRTFDFGQKTVVVGENGSGKSNMLEAIYALATGKSYRADREEEMITYNQKFSILNFQFSINDQLVNSQINLTDGTMGVTRKKFEVNGVPKRMIDFVGRFRAVLFGPEDMELVTGSPSGRRRYLDFVISQADREYRRCFVSYEKGLRQRNKLLERIREGMATRSQLFFWDKLLIRNGEYITDKRGQYLGQLNVQDSKFNTQYDKSVISEMRLKQYEIEEVAAAATLVGPHRDDFQVHMMTLDGKHDEHMMKDVSKYGSRGEQRMAVMWLKQGELDYLSHFAEASRDAQQPVLLLDDIFSELDHKHRKEIEIEIDKLVESGGQVILTTADEHNLPKDDGWRVIEL
jgi:DNA replication and repair protein RecF